ncbi:MAG TPA: NAD(P)-binding domain-containing protein, partial [Candidatus Binatia bacterium]
MPSGIGVVGAGGWGTTLAKVLAEKGEQVVLWCHGADSFRQIADKRENQTYLPGIALPPNIEVTQSLDEAVESKFLVICAVPSHAVRQVFTKSAAKIEPETMLLCGTKGIEEGSLKT